MESSFKQEYDKQTLSNGDIEISFKAERIGAHAGANLLVGFIALFGGLFIWVLMIGALFYFSDGKPDGGVLPTFIASYVIWFGLIYLFNHKKSVIIVRPNEGIIFNNKQLPFTDIKEIGTQHETTARNAKGNAYVYAYSGGKEIKITSYMPLARADAISAEINRYLR